MDSEKKKCFTEMNQKLLLVLIIIIIISYYHFWNDKKLTQTNKVISY